MKDLFGREISYLRLSVTDRCNLRCRYCMPETGICKKLLHEDMLTEDEMITAVEVAAELGISKLRITGGEPLVKKNIVSICSRAAAVEGINEVCLTTNATLLPQYAKDLKEAGVSRLNISLDTLNPEKYAHMTRLGSLSDALEGLDAAISAGFDKIKVNAVLIGGFNDDEIVELTKLTIDRPIDVRFIEMMPMVNEAGFDKSAFIKGDTVLAALPDAVPVDDRSGVAAVYRLPGALGNVGVISAVSNDFCARCNRIRLTADGKLKPCLHSSHEFSIKGLGREEIKEQMKKTICSKPAKHAELSAVRTSESGRSMNQIGG